MPSARVMVAPPGAWTAVPAGYLPCEGDGCGCGELEWLCPCGVLPPLLVGAGEALGLAEPEPDGAEPDGDGFGVPLPDDPCEPGCAVPPGPGEPDCPWRCDPG